MTSPFSIPFPPDGHTYRPPRRLRSDREPAYRLRLLLGLCLSIALMLGLTRLPWPASQNRAGWGSTGEASRVMFDVVELPDPETESETREGAMRGDAAPATSFFAPSVPAEQNVAAEEPAEESVNEPEEAEGTGDRQPFPELARMPVISFAEEQPDIVGGLNSLYLRVRYPLAAQEAGIQGLVVLRFIVELDGSASHIQVARSLHPLCDSAAVEAVRNTKFRPARQNGQDVRVRMNLPIRFLLVNERTGEPIAPDTTARRPAQ